MAVTHPVYNLMKMPGSNGVLTVARDTKDALQALKLAFKTAATAVPGKKEDQEAPEAVPAKK